jgi:hypothetical protein
MTATVQPTMSASRERLAGWFAEGIVARTLVEQMSAHQRCRERVEGLSDAEVRQWLDRAAAIHAAEKAMRHA